MFYDSITKFVFIYKSLWKLGERTDAISMIKWQIEKIISKQCFLAFPVKTVNYILTWFLYVLRRKAQLQIYKTRFVMASIQFIRDKFLARRKQFSLHFNWTASKYELWHNWSGCSVLYFLCIIGVYSLAKSIKELCLSVWVIGPSG